VTKVIRNWKTKYLTNVWKEKFMDSIELSRSVELTHHIKQAVRWLELSELGEKSTPLSYAAFEIRLATERLCMEYYFNLVSAQGEKPDSNVIMSFKKMKNKIFGMAGYQKEINKQFEITRVIMKIMNIEIDIPTPNFGRFSAIWHDCSEGCHIFWNVAEAVGLEDSGHDPYSDLTGYAEELAGYAKAAGTWLQVRDSNLNDVIKGCDDAEDYEETLRVHFEKIGVHAVYLPADGNESVAIGTPIEPA
jgi:hypothetical protein